MVFAWFSRKIIAPTMRAIKDAARAIQRAIAPKLKAAAQHVADRANEVVASFRKDPKRAIAAVAWEVFKLAVVIVVPGLLWGPVLTLLGFGAVGIVGGSAASALQSWIGPISARSLFAILQSAGQGGYGVAMMNSLVRAGGVAWLATRSRSDGREPPRGRGGVDQLRP